MLAVDVDELVGGLAKLRERRAAAVDPRPALALRVDRPAQDEQAFVVRSGVEASLGKPVRNAGRRVELGGYFAAPSSLANDACVAAAAERQLQRVDEDRLAGAGLAGQYRKAAIEVDFEFSNDDEVAQRQPPQHPSALPAFQCSLRRSVA